MHVCGQASVAPRDARARPWQAPRKTSPPQDESALYAECAESTASPAETAFCGFCGFCGSCRRPDCSKTRAGLRPSPPWRFAARRGGTRTRLMEIHDSDRSSAILRPVRNREGSPASVDTTVRVPGFICVNRKTCSLGVRREHAGWYRSRPPRFRPGDPIETLSRTRGRESTARRKAGPHPSFERAALKQPRPVAVHHEAHAFAPRCESGSPSRT